MLKRTKIIATLGPSTNDQAIIEKLILAGANVFRLNFSHGTHDDHRQRAEIVRAAAAAVGKQVALLGDLQGPKIRIAKFADGPINLAVGDPLILDCAMDQNAGTREAVGVTYPQLASDCRAGQVLLLDDGRLELTIEKVEGSKLYTKTLIGGKLSSNKGINLRDGGLSAPALTDKDYADMKCAATIDLDYLAISFPRSADDMNLARKAAESEGCFAKLVAKVERAEAVADDETLDKIILASDAVMVARGDLGVEIGDAELIGVQKKMIRRARQLNRIVVTATQMMETMIDSSLPTRAEVFDVANAVLDGTDAVMLSAETAAGQFPVQTVEAMTRIIRGAEKETAARKSGHRIDRTFDSINETVAMATMYAANHLPPVKAILSLTESGNTPLLMSRIRSGLPIFGISRNQKALNTMCLYRGVMPMLLDSTATDNDSAIASSLKKLKEKGELAAGDLVLCTHGEVMGQGGGTNSLSIVSVD